MILETCLSWVNLCEGLQHYCIERSEIESAGFAVFGAGFHTREVVLPALLQAGLRPCCILDGNSTKHGQFLCDIPIKPSSELRNIQHLPVLLSGGNIKSMISTCRTHDHQQWFVPGAMAHFCWTAGEIGMHPSKLLTKNNIENVYAMLNDDISRNIFMEILKYQCIFEEDLFSHQEGNTYFPRELSKKIDYRWFVDGGAYNGDTLAAWKQHVFKTCHDSHMYAAFEPSRKSYTELNEYILCNFSEDSNIKAYNAALGEGAGTICLTGENTPAASIVTVNSFRSDEVCIPIIALDSINLAHVSCIKADVEGFELALLKGAVKTIEKYRPTLMVSVYHKQLDVIDIPAFISELDLDYKFYLRHHWPTYGDTVCYMIPENQKKFL